MLDFIKGNSNVPTGNLIVFCYVHGKNPIQPEASIIVSNVVVSYVSAAQNSFPVVVFPPDALVSAKELNQLIQLNEAYDVIQLHDFEFPAEIDEQTYLRDRMEHLNQCVIEYVEHCRVHIESQLDKSTSNLEIVPGKPREKKLNEVSALDSLQEFLEEQAPPGPGPAELESGNLRDAIKFLKINYPKYDVEKLERVLSRSGQAAMNLAQLYLEKYRAVFEERFETAARLKDRIEKLEANLFLQG